MKKQEAQFLPLDLEFYWEKGVMEKIEKELKASNAIIK